MNPLLFGFGLVSQLLGHIVFWLCGGIWGNPHAVDDSPQREEYCEWLWWSRLLGEWADDLQVGVYFG